MRIDWKARLRNPYFWTAIISGILVIIQAFGLKFDNQSVMNAVKVFEGVFIALGILIDPSSPGLFDRFKQKKKYMLKRDEEDPRDLIFENTIKPLPKVDLRPKMPPVVDQGQLGSCTANAGVSVMEYLNPLYLLSRLYMYFKERVLEKTVNTDSGASVRDECKVAKKGVCEEKYMVYDINKFTVPPSKAAKANALLHTIDSYKSIKSTDDIKKALTLGSPVLFGMSVYESFEGSGIAKTGKMPIPKPKETYLGGHAPVFVGYDDNKKIFIVRNSWGVAWGDKGYFYMPYNYVTLSINGTPCTYDYWIME